MNQSRLSFADHIFWIAFLIVLAVLVVCVDFKLNRPPAAFKTVVISILLLIAVVVAVKARRKRGKPERGVCDVCGATRSLWKGYSVTSGIKESTSESGARGGQDGHAASFSDIRSHLYQSCGACERKKYVLRILALCLTVGILMLFGQIWPDEKGSKFFRDTLKLLSMMTVAAVFYSVRFLCPVGKLEKKAVGERIAAEDPEKKKKWDACG
jgi:uncharacterized membrane protein YhaH (DUF805 family)